MALQKCPRDGITEFPLQLTTRPTEADYEARMEVITMDFQWGPLTTGVTPTKTTNYVLLQEADTTSSVLYKSTRYTIFSVQIAKASHTNWLIDATVAATNKEDLIITLISTDTKSNDMYIIIVVPILRGGSGPDPAYLANVGKPGVTSYDLGSCLPPKTGANAGNVIFAMYSTCIDGYTGRADTQNVFVLVSTSGISVTAAVMNGIVSGATLSGSIYKPPTFSHMSRVVTSIDLSDFPKYITATRYLTDITTERLVEQRKDKAEQYKCMEIDPDAQVDDNGNMIIDVNKGDVTNLKLNDILAERKILKDMVVPTDSEAKRMVGTIIEYVFAMVVILVVAAVVYVTIYSKGQLYYALAAFFICFCLFLATVLGLVGYKTKADNLYIGSYVLLGLGALTFIIWLPMWWNASQAAPAVTAAAGAAGAGATAVAGAGAGAQPAPDFTSYIAKIPVYGVVAAVSLLGGFVIGNFY